MSKINKIEKEILAATGEDKLKRNEDGDAYLVRLVRSMHKLSDKEWDKLSKASQEWFNDAAEAKNKKKQLPAIPGSSGSEEEDDDDAIPTRGSKKGGKGKDDTYEPELEEGLEVILYGKKDKVLAEGEVIEVTKKQVTVLNDDEDEKSVSQSRIVRFDIIDSGTDDDKEEAASGEEEDVEIDDIEKDQNVRIITEDDETVEGVVEKVTKKAITIDGTKYKKDEIEEAYVLAENAEDTSGEEIDPDDVEEGMNVSIEMKNGDVVEGIVTKVAKKSITIDDEKCSIAKIVSINTIESEVDEVAGDVVLREVADAVRDIICKYPKMKLEKISKKVAKADIEIDEDALENIYNDTQTVIEMLKSHGKLA